MSDMHETWHLVLGAIRQGAKTIPAIAGNSGLAHMTVYERLAYLREHHQTIACCDLMAGPDGVSPRVQIPSRYGGDTYAAVVARLNAGKSQAAIARAERERSAREAAEQTEKAASLPVSECRWPG